jgi:UDP-N-acetylglucosamine--N-acetylmuramyl-(pentapeptide) pyrophosphoryl-undecaprenol N-acetylglucosamine transferase
VSGTHLLLASGGTGGHVFPALALAQRAQQAGWRVTLFGTDEGPERAWSEGAGVPFEGVPSGKLDRQRPSLRALWRAGVGVRRATARLRQLNPDLVVGFGGFGSLPAVAAAWLTGTPYALHETNAVPGLVTRVFARRARLVVITQAETGAHLPTCPTDVVPMPVRERRVDRHTARMRLGIPADALLTLVMGGSQGSLYLNEHVPPIASRLQAAHPQLWLLHQTGPRWLTATVGRYPDTRRVRLEPFVDAADAFGAADLAITRGGYGTLAEAAFHGVPLVVVPLPSAAEDHQRHNAEALERAGAGLMAAQGDDIALEQTWRRLLGGERDAARAAMLQRSPAGGAQLLFERLQQLIAPLPGSRET